MANNYFNGIVPVAREDATIAENILAQVAAMRKDGSLDSGASLCWAPAELERLAMFAIAAKNDLARLPNVTHAMTRMPTNEEVERAVFTLFPSIGRWKEGEYGFSYWCGFLRTALSDFVLRRGEAVIEARGVRPTPSDDRENDVHYGGTPKAPTEVGTQSSGLASKGGGE